MRKERNATVHVRLSTYFSSLIFLGSLAVLGIGTYVGIATGRLGQYREYFLLLTIANGLVSLLFIPLLEYPTWDLLPVWLTCAFFVVGYWLQLFWMTIDPGSVMSVHWFLPDLASDPRNLIAAYSTCTLAFCGLCFGAWGHVIVIAGAKYPEKGRGHGEQAPEIPTREARPLAIILFGVTLCSMTFTSIFMAMTGIAVMGAESVYLPFRSAGLVFFWHSVLIPIFLACLVAVCDKLNPYYFATAMVLVFVHGISGAVLRSSRGALLYVVGVVFCMLIASGRLTAARVRAFVLIGILNVLMYPVITVYRYFRVEMSRGTDLWNFIINVWERSWETAPIWIILGDSLKTLFWRLNGMASLLPIASSGLAPVQPDSWSSVIGREGLTRHFTWQILQYPQDAPHSSAPTWLGWAYLLLGDAGVVIGAIVVSWVALVVWRMIGRSRLRTKAVAQAAVIVFLAMVLTEGTFERLWLDLCVITLGIAVCECFHHAVGKCVFVRPSIAPGVHVPQARGSHKSAA